MDKPTLSESEKKQLLEDVLYSVTCLMGNSGSWTVTKNTDKFGITYQNENPTATTVTLEEVTNTLEKAFATDQETIQRFRENDQQRKPAEFQLTITELEAKIPSIEYDKGHPNLIRIKVGPKFSQEHETSQLIGTQKLKWKNNMNITIDDMLKDYLYIELWHEEEKIPNKGQTTRPILFANIKLSIKDILESGITGWYKLQNSYSNRNEVFTLHIEGQLECLSRWNETPQNAYDKILKCLMDHVEMEHAKPTDQSKFNCDSGRDNVPASVIAIMEQYALVLNLSQASQLLSWFNAEVPSCKDWKLTLKHFIRIKEFIVLGYYSDEQKEFFTKALTKLIYNCKEKVQHLETYFPVTDKDQSQLKALLQIMKKIQDHAGIEPLLKNFHMQEEIKEGLRIFSKQRWVYIHQKVPLCSKEIDEQLKNVLKIINEVFDQLELLIKLYDILFYDESNICCVKVFYCTIMGEMLKAIKPVIQSCCEAVPTSEAAYNEGIRIDFLKRSPLMNIYEKLRSIALLRCVHISKTWDSQTGIEKYYILFETGFKHQLYLTTDRESNRIKEVIDNDILVPIDSKNQKYYSKSLKEAKAIAHRFKVWWVELSFPGPDFTIYLKEVLAKLNELSRTYCDEISKKIEFIYEESHATSNTIINEKVCVGICNINKMMKEIAKFPKIFGYNLEEENVTDEHANQIKSMIESETENVNRISDSIIAGVLNRREDFLENLIIESCAKDDKDFRKSILHPTMDLLQDILELSNMQKVLKCLWETLLTVIRNIITNNPKRKSTFYGELHKLISFILSDFTPESGEGLDAQSAQTPEYSSLIEDLQIMESDSFSLMTLYYKNLLIEQSKESSQPSASLNIEAWLTDTNRLKVNVVMVKNIDAPKDKWNFTPVGYYIKVKILLAESGQLSGKRTHRENTDPAIFDEELEINISGQEACTKAGVMVLILRAHNLFRSDTFLGEAVIPLANVALNISEAKPIPLKMTKPAFGQTMPTFAQDCKRILKVLSNRKKWDKSAAAFIRRLKKQYSVKSFRKDRKDEEEKEGSKRRIGKFIIVRNMEGRISIRRGYHEMRFI